jgi:hypothetical protein
MFYILLIAMIVGWYEGGTMLSRTHNGLISGTEPSSNLAGFLFLDKRTQ